MKIAIAGATGRVGRLLGAELRRRGHELAPISRSDGVDLVTGEGLLRALAGAECVVDTSNSSSSEQNDATQFFTAAARNLQAAGERAGVRRVVALSIIGCDRFRAGYYVAKVAQEQTLLAGAVPVTILRAAQFHEFVEQSVNRGRRGGVSLVRRMRTQLVAARCVAEALADLAAGSDDPGEIAGPQVEELVETAELLVARRGDPVRIEPLSDPDNPDTELYETGGLLPGPEAKIVGPTFEDWLRAQP